MWCLCVERSQENRLVSECAVEGGQWGGYEAGLRLRRACSERLRSSCENGLDMVRVEVDFQ